MVETLLSLGLANALAATLLALVAAVVWRIGKRPAVLHALWLLVLIKLLTPPFVALPVSASILPSSFFGVDRNESETTVAMDGSAEGLGINRENQADTSAPPVQARSDAKHRTVNSDAPEIAQSPTGAASTAPSGQTYAWSHDAISLAGISWTYLAAGCWLTGSLVWCWIVVVRLRRSRLLLRHAQPVSAFLQQRANQLARRMGMRAAPKLFFVPMPISPSLLAVTHAPRLLLPKTLWDRLSDAQQQTLLVHELAHLRRRDHWVRRLELVALCLYWWFPVMWYARRALHEAEELCCDAWVVWTLPESSQCYAETLVETLAFLAESRNAVPLGASGIKNTKSMKRRLTMILKQNTSRSLPLVGLLLVLLLAAAVLPLYPTAAQTVAGPDEVPTANQATNESEATPEKFSPTKADPSSARQNKTKEDNGGARAESENDSYGEETYGPPITAIPQARIAEAKDKLELAKLQVELLKAELRQVLVLLDQANAEYKRLRVLADKNVVTAKELLAASYEAKVVQAKVEAKEVALRQSELLFAQAQRRYEELLAAGKSKTPPDAAPIKSSGKKSSPAQVTAAKKAYEIFLKAFMAGELKDVEKCYLWSRRWLQAEMALSKKQSKRKAALHSHAGRMVALQEIIQDMAQAGAATGVDLAAAEYYVVEARQWLAESK